MITKIIKTILYDYTPSSEIDLIVSNWKQFFFKSGKTNENFFLIPENEYEQGIVDFNNIINFIYE